jgi:thioredoxin reductase (NADPH)
MSIAESKVKSIENKELEASDPYRRLDQTYPTLTDHQVEQLKQYGVVEDLSKGTCLFKRNDRSVDFFVILESAVEIYEHKKNNEIEIFAVHGKNQFTGEIDLFNNRKILVGGRMQDDGKVLRLTRAQFKKMMISEPELSEIIMRAFILRRVALINHQQGGIVLLSNYESADTMRIERFLKRNGYPLKKLDCTEDSECAEIMADFKIAKEDLPVVVIHLGEQVLKSPTNYKLASELGLDEDIDLTETYDTVIVGGGPSGLSAAVYASSEGLNTLLIEKEAPGGQASTSSKIENYLGFPTGLSGQALAGRAQIQAMKFGTKVLLPYMVKSMNCNSYPYEIELCDNRKLKARSVIVSSGAKYRTLNIEDSRKFDNAGVYYAATAMEGEICKNEEVIVVGGGNSAGQAAVFLSGKARHVYILVRSKSLAASMSNYLIERIDSSPKITLCCESEIVKLDGEEHLEKVTIMKNKDEDNTEIKDIRHVFLMIGAVPNSDWVENCLALDKKGFIKTGNSLESEDLVKYTDERKPMMFETSQPGIFATGDIRSESTKRVASGVGEGAISVSQVHQYLATQL